MTLPDHLNLTVGDEVRHWMSGWTGTVAAIYTSTDQLPESLPHADESWRGYGFDQGPIILVDPVRAGGKTWKAITVTAAELERI